MVDLVELAEEQLELALSRGGDQCVVLIGKEIYYYGAKSMQLKLGQKVTVRFKAEKIVI